MVLIKSNFLLDTTCSMHHDFYYRNTHYPIELLPFIYFLEPVGNVVPSI